MIESLSVCSLATGPGGALVHTHAVMKAIRCGTDRSLSRLNMVVETAHLS